MIARFRSMHLLQQIAVVMWFWLIIGISGRVAVSKVTVQSVMPIYLDSAERWQRGDDLYEWKPPHDIYRNPPGVAAAFVPFTWIPERLAGLVWRWLSAAVFLVGLLAWTRHGLPRELRPWETGLLFALTVPFALPSLNNGQTNLIIIGLLLLGVTAVARGRGWLAGGWLAGAAYIKVYPAAVALLLAAASPRRVAPRFAVACAVLVALPFLFQSAAYVEGQYRSFRDATRSKGDRTLAVVPHAPRDLYLVLRVWATPPSQEVYTGIKLAVAAGMAALVVLVWRRTRDMKHVAPLALGLGCVWMTVLGPATEVHTYTLLGPTAAAAVVFAIAERRWGIASLAVVGSGLLISPVIRDMFPNGGAFHALGPQPVGGVLLLAAIVWQALRPREKIATLQSAEQVRTAA